MRKVTGQSQIHLWCALMVLQSKANELHYNPGDERDGIFWLPKTGSEENDTGRMQT